MERKKYLEFCQKNACLIDKIKVLYDGVEYYPYYYEMKFDADGKTINTAVLLDKKANSLIKAKMERLEEIEK